MTEINDNAIKYARQNLGMHAEKFNFFTDKIQNIFMDKFDIVLMGAAVMFCKHLSEFVIKIIKPNGLLIQHRCVHPTLGVLLRTQFDEYNYQVLYQPETLITEHSKAGFSLQAQENETDPSMYG